jgi:hypothetical protein
MITEVVDLDRREPETRETRDRAGLPHEAREVVPGGAVAEAAEVDAGQDDLAVALLDPAADLSQDRGCRSAAGRTSDVGDHAERTAEATAVLNLHERTHAVETDADVRTAESADVGRNEARSVLAPHRDDSHVPGQAGEGPPREIRAAAGHVHPLRPPRRAPRCLSRLRNRLVRDAARADDRHVGLSCDFDMTVGKQTLTYLLHVHLRDLAAEEIDGEGRHRPPS